MSATDAGAAAPCPAIAASFFLGPDARFRLTDWCSVAGVTLTITGQLLTLEGGVIPFVETHTPNSDRSSATKIFASGRGWLLDAQITVSTGTVRRGQCFARLEIVQGSTGAVQALATVLQDYVTTAYGLSYPSSPVRSSLEGPGFLRSLAGTDPAAGAECSDTVPTGARWRLVSARFPLVTDATVANRFVTIILDDGTTTLYQAPDNTAHVASVTISHVFGDGLGTFGTTAVNYVGPLPRNPVLLAGWRIRTSTQGLTGTDNYGAPQYYLEEWLEQ